jgi:hypothetical protein
MGERGDVPFRGLVSLGLVAALVACSEENLEIERLRSAELAITHDFTQFAPNMPAHLAIVFSMSWFGLPSTDVQSVAPGEPAGNYDKGFQNWQVSAACSGQSVSSNACSTCIRWGWNTSTGSPTCLATGASQRQVSSRRRPLAGIYSAAGITAESINRTKLMLSMLRRPDCGDSDGHARLDVWAPQNVGIRYSTRYCAKTDTCYSLPADLPYQAMMSMFREADNAGLTNAVMPAHDIAWFFNHDKAGCDADTNDPANPPATCLAAIRQEFRDMAVEANLHASALKIAGKPVILVWGLQHLSVPKWNEVFNGARNDAGIDFFTIGFGETTANFGAFDGLAPGPAAARSRRQPATLTPTPTSTPSRSTMVLLTPSAATRAAWCSAA